MIQVSDVFGNLSQAFWLFAQLPQIWTNYRNKSVEGLSLPFLLNWLSGDVTNLIGCLLTNQLLFQRNLAIYFNLIDLILIAQFALYSGASQPSNNHYAPISESYLQPALSSDNPVDRQRTNNKLGLDFSVDSNHPHSDQTSKVFPSRGLPQTPRSTFNSNQPNHYDENLLSPLPNRPSHTRCRLTRAFRSLFNAKPFILLAIFSFIAFQINTHHQFFSLNGKNTTDLLTHQSTNHELSISTNETYRANHKNSNTSSTSAPGMMKAASKADEKELEVVEGLKIKKDSWKQKLGRLSAWLCAFLYLTSRIPQIMKNYTRKSVEGLSILLFVLAFLGNLTYVLSILTSPQILLTNPRHHKLSYLNESVPYLIGSAGTLCFDFTIFIQSIIYGKPSTVFLNTARNLPSTLSSPSITCSNVINPSPPLGSPSTLSIPSGSKSSRGNCPACPLLSSRSSTPHA